MHTHVLDTYAHLDSPVHRAPAGLKLLAALAIVILLVSLPPSRLLFAVAGVTLIAVSVVSRVPARFIVKRLLTLEPFVLGVAVLTLFQPDGPRLFAIVVTRTTLCILTLILLSNTTPFTDLVRVLKAARVPAILITTVSLMHRYLHVLRDETGRMRRARASRTFTRTRGAAWRGLASVISQLFCRSTDRAERIYAAMCARGWR
jgi:cobalt/nickel transport system permease protein